MDLKRLKRNQKIISLKRSALLKAGKKFVNGQESVYTEIYEKLIDLVNWLVNTNDWLQQCNETYRENKRSNNEVNGTIEGLRYVFNTFKHEVNAVDFCLQNYLLLGESEDKDEKLYLEVSNWVGLPPPNLKNVSEREKKSRERHYKSYNTYLKGRSIYETTLLAKDFIYSESSRILNESAQITKNL